MNWYLKQLLGAKDLVSLQKDLLALHLTLQEKDSKPQGIMKNMIYKDLTLKLYTRNTLKDILINLEKD